MANKEFEQKDRQLFLYGLFAGALLGFGAVVARELVREPHKRFHPPKRSALGLKEVSNSRSGDDNGLVVSESDPKAPSLG